MQSPARNARDRRRGPRRCRRTRRRTATPRDAAMSAAYPAIPERRAAQPPIQPPASLDARELDRVDVDRSRLAGRLSQDQRQPGFDRPAWRHRFQLVLVPGVGWRRRIGDRTLFDPDHCPAAEILRPVIVKLDLYEGTVLRVRQLLAGSDECGEPGANPFAGRHADALAHPGIIGLADRLAGDLQRVRAIPHRLPVHPYVRRVVDAIAEDVPAGRGASAFVETAVLKRPAPRFLGKLVDADPIHEESLWPDRRVVRGRQEVAADRRVDYQPHWCGEFRQEVARLVVVERRVVDVVDVEPQLVLDPLAGECVKTVGVRYELVPDRRLLLDRE